VSGAVMLVPRDPGDAASDGAGSSIEAGWDWAIAVGAVVEAAAGGGVAGGGAATAGTDAGRSRTRNPMPVESPRMIMSERPESSPVRSQR
jgi:hypothetical protein